MPDFEHVSGVIERVTFHNEDNGYAVLKVQADKPRQLVTVVGHLSSVVAGEFVEAAGQWVNDRDHGLQFKADELRTTPPHTEEGIVKYLGSGLIKGIGPKYAKKIVETFGARTLEVIDASPAHLKEVKGIGPQRLERIRQSWQEQRSVRALMVFLQSYGIGTARAVRIYKTYGDDALEKIKSNPYRLTTDIWGIGFKTADDLARRIGLPPNSPLRARAAVRYVLQEASGQGHVGYPEHAVIDKTMELTQIPPEVIREVIEAGRVEDEFVRDVPPPEQETRNAERGARNVEPGAADAEQGAQTADQRADEPPSSVPRSEFRVPSSQDSWLYLKPLFLAELGVARAIQQLRRGGHPLPAIDADAALRWVEQRMRLELAPTQREAIRAAATEKVLVITGGPGVGKTTIVRGILEIFTAKRKRVALCAPTGRAAKRLSESTGHQASTIHRLLEFDPGVGHFKRHRENPLDVDLLVMDEASMVDIVLMNQLLRAVPPWACLVLVGDVDQLPSVGPGSVLADLIASKAVKVVRLTEIFRQAGQSHIVRAAHAVNHGEEPRSAPDGSGDFYFIEADAPATILERIIYLVRERIPARFGLDPLKDVQVLTPMNKSELGVRNLNQRLQEVLNPNHSGKQVERFGWAFRVGDKVLQTQNDYNKEVFNGDIGRIADIDATEQEVLVEFEGRRVPYDFSELDELSLAFATSIHKSQGSEYAAVIVPLHTQHFVLLQRNLLYTAITRGKKLVVLVGSRKALWLAVQRHDTVRRFSMLRWRLASAQAGPPVDDTLLPRGGGPS
jgi:exodeoxyribonuclease V alpha subunit